jgi:hypothetical protein
MTAAARAQEGQARPSLTWGALGLVALSPVPACVPWGLWVFGSRENTGDGAHVAGLSTVAAAVLLAVDHRGLADDDR